MVTTTLIGGLGNYLFQIMAAYALAKENNDSCIFDFKSAKIGHNNIETYRTNILRNINDGSFNCKISYNEPFFHYKKIPYVKDLRLNGYFQSEKYFKNYRSEIIDLLSIDNDSKNYIEKKYSNIDFDKSCSVHVRRGDYLNLQLYHPVCELEYYSKSFNLIDSEIFLIFSDDIEWCKVNFKNFNKKIIYVEGNCDYVDLWLMSLCKNNIIANSTFSWWGAWLNNHSDKKVIIPKKWFGSLNNLITDDLIVENWIAL